MYQREVRYFLEYWWIETDYNLDEWPELDECAVSYCHYNNLPRARVSTLHAAIALALPLSKGRLLWLKMINEESIKQSFIKHALGMPRTAALILGVIISQMISQRVGALLVVQQGRGLRPSEVLTLESASITLPGDNVYRRGMLTLGLRGATKSGRPEYVLLDPQEHQLELSLCAWMRRIGRPNETISLNLSVSGFTKIIQSGCSIAQLPKYSGHSGRAGFVSDEALKGVPLSKIQETTRHSAPKTLRTYLDTVNHMQQLQHEPVRKWAQVARLIASYPHQFFPQIANGPVLDPLKLV